MSAHVFNTQLAQRTVDRYVCSNCWGHLVQKHVEGGSLVECHSCEDETNGFVTKSFAEHRRSESVGEKLETKKMLRDLNIIENPHAGKEAKELLSEMGF